MSSTCWTTTGASPSDSSSMMSTSGSRMRVIARARSCCWPPDRSSAGVPSRSRSIGNSSSTRSVCSCSSWGANTYPAMRRFSSTVSGPKVAPPPMSWTMPIRARSSGSA